MLNICSYTHTYMQFLSLIMETSLCNRLRPFKKLQCIIMQSFQSTVPTDIYIDIDIYTIQLQNMRLRDPWERMNGQIVRASGTGTWLYSLGMSEGTPTKSHQWLPKRELNKDNNHRHVIMDGVKAVRPTLHKDPQGRKKCSEQDDIKRKDK